MQIILEDEIFVIGLNFLINIIQFDRYINYSCLKHIVNQNEFPFFSSFFINIWRYLHLKEQLVYVQSHQMVGGQVTLSQFELQKINWSLVLIDIDRTQ